MKRNIYDHVMASLYSLRAERDIGVGAIRRSIIDNEACIEQTKKAITFAEARKDWPDYELDLLKYQRWISDAEAHLARIKPELPIALAALADVDAAIEEATQCLESE
jgi:hypothetical protein